MANPKTWSVLKEELFETFRKWQKVEWSITPEKNLTPRARYYSLDERLVTVRFRDGGKLIGLACASEPFAKDNLALLVLAIESLRMNEVRKIHRLVAGAYGLMYPPPPFRITEPDPDDEGDPYAILGVPASYPLAVIEKIWKAHLLATHPDVGGSEERAKRLNTAMDEIRRRRA